MKYINGTWEIEDIDMVLDPDGEDIDLFCNMDALPQLVLAGNYNNELTITTLDGQIAPTLTHSFYDT